MHAIIYNYYDMHQVIIHMLYLTAYFTLHGMEGKTKRIQLWSAFSKITSNTHSDLIIRRYMDSNLSRLVFSQPTTIGHVLALLPPAQLVLLY